MTAQSTSRVVTSEVSQGVPATGASGTGKILSDASAAAPSNVLPWLEYWWGDDVAYAAGKATTWAGQIGGYALTAVVGKEPFEPRGFAINGHTAPYFRCVRSASELAWDAISSMCNAAAIRGTPLHDLTAHILVYQHAAPPGWSDRSEALYVGDSSVNATKWAIGLPTTTDLTKVGLALDSVWYPNDRTPEGAVLRAYTFVGSSTDGTVGMYIDGVFHSSTPAAWVADTFVLDHVSLGAYGFAGAMSAPTEGYIFAAGIADHIASAGEVASLFALERVALGLLLADYDWTPWSEATGHHLYLNNRYHRYDAAISRERVKHWGSNGTAFANPSAGTITAWPRWLDGVDEDFNGRPVVEFGSGGEATLLGASDDIANWRDNTTGRGWHYTACWIRCEVGDITSTSAIGYQGNVIIGELGAGVWALSCYSADGFTWVRGYMWDGASRTVRVKITEGDDHFVEWWKDSSGIMHLRIDGAAVDGSDPDHYATVAVGNYVSGLSAVTIGNGYAGAAGTRWKGKLGAIENYGTHDATRIAQIRTYFTLETGIALE